MEKPDMPMRVLVAVDGSEASAEALALVSGVAWPADTTIDIVTVVQPVAPVAAGPWALSAITWTSDATRNAMQIDAEFQRHSRDLVHAARTHVASPSRRVETAVLMGRPAVAILDRAHVTDADLIVVGSRGHSTIETMLLGSVSAEIIDHADRPVLVARTASMARLALAVDGSESAAGAARLITDWSIFSGSKVLVISVAPMQPPWWTGLREMAVPDTVDAFDDIVGRSHDCHERVATDWTGRISDQGIDAEPMRRKGDPAAEIIAAAGAWDADLIIMGTRGITGVRRAMLGSVARNVLAHAPCSVLVVRASAAVETTLAPISTLSASGGGSSSTT